MKIIHQQEICIGCGSCVAVCPERWEMAESGKAHLIGSKISPETGNEEVEIKKVSCNDEAANICPVQCIKIVK
jgi:ferredoxin